MPKRDQFVPMSRSRRRIRRLGRKALWAAGVVAVLALLALADRAGLFGLSDWHAYEGRTFTVVKVVDGDTLDVDRPDGRYDHTRVRLLGVDAPESVDPRKPVEHFGPEAAVFVRDAVAGKPVTLRLDAARTRDKYGRLLAYVILADGTNLNEQIVATGHAYADPRYRNPLKAALRRAQDRAAKAGLGLWQAVRRKDLPYYYRKTLPPPDPAATRRTDR